MIHVQGIDIADIVSKLSKVTDVYSGNIHIWPSDIKVVGYGEWSIILTPETYTFPSTAGQYDFTAVASRDIYWSDGSTTKDTVADETLFTWSITGDGFSINENNGVVNITANPGTTARSGVITVSYEGASDTSTVYQDGSEEVIEYSDWQLDVKVEPDVLGPINASAYAYCKCYRTVTVKVNGVVTDTYTEYDNSVQDFNLTWSDPITGVGEKESLKEENWVRQQFTVADNESTESREWFVTIQKRRILKSVYFTQNGTASLTVTPLTVTWSESEWGSKEININTSDDWSITIE